MIRLKLGLGLCLGLWSITAAQGAALSLASTDRILILAPHPDDETLGFAAAVIQLAAAAHIPLKIVYLTYGDFNKWSFTLYRHSPVFRPETMRAMGEVRRTEALAAAQVLGLAPENLAFSGLSRLRNVNPLGCALGRCPRLRKPEHTRQSSPLFHRLAPRRSL